MAGCTRQSLRGFPFEISIIFYFTISKSYFINYTIPFYNTPNIPKLYYFTILLKYYFFNLFLLLLFQPSFFFFKINYSQLFQMLAFPTVILPIFFLFSFFSISIYFQLFHQPANFFFNLFPTISTIAKFFFFRKNLPNINSNS